VIKLPTLGLLARNTLSLTSGMGSRAMVLAVLFVLLSRNLGVEQYGQLVLVMSLVGFVYPLVGLGASMLMLRDIAQARENINSLWGRALLVTLMTAVPLVILVMILGYCLLPEIISFRLLLYIALSELVIVPVIELGGTLYQALEKAAWTSVFMVGTALFRLGAFMLMLVFSASLQANVWGFYYLVATAIFAVLAFAFTCRDIGAPRFVMPEVRTVVRDGVGYSLMNASSRLSVDVDKVMLGRMDSVAATGLYAAGYRIIDMMFLPLSALLWALISRFFRKGEAGVSAAFRYALRVLPMPVLYTVVCMSGIYLCARYLPLLLGSDFRGVDLVVYWLAPLIAVLLVRHMLRLVVIGAMSSFVAAIIEITGVLANIGGNLLLIPGYGWRGSAAATFASETFMIICLLVVMAYATLAGRSRPDPCG
jgi:O-antigen/teichoic acid export membrane protein